MKLFRLISIILLLSFISASKIEFDRYNIDDGLSQNTVYKVFQDSRGYIWLGTQGGLDRFNGYDFKHYEHESNDSSSIVNGWIRTINEDENGLLWLGTLGGNLGWFDPYSEVGGVIDLYSKHPGVKKPRWISNILFHGDYIFLTTRGSGLCRYDRNDESTLWYSEDSTAKHYIKDQNFNDIVSISENEILFGDRSLITLNTKTNRYKKPYCTTIEEKLGIPMDSIKISSIKKGANGNFYIGTWSDHGLIILNTSNQSAEQYFPLEPDSNTGKIPRTMIGDIAIDKSDNLWIPLYNVGLSTFDLVKKSFDLHLPDPKNQNSLSDAQIESIMIDNSGSIWLGAARSLMNHDSEKKKFSLISNSQKADIISSYDEKWGLYFDSNDNY